MRALSIGLLRDTLSVGRNLTQTIKAVQSKNLGIRRTQLRMEHKQGRESRAMKVNPNVDKLLQLMQSDSTGGWEKSWEQGLTPWDLGKPTPIVLHLQQTGSLPEGRALIPGCGSGHDVVAIACPRRFVVGLDISDNAIKKAKEELFDLIFDYTFFYAIEPGMRSAWARVIQDILKQEGELITLMFPISNHDGGPPYKVSIFDYEEVLHPVGFEAISIVDNELAIGPRKGREKLGRWKRSRSQSLL